jgi:hypothetical protein
VQAASVSIHGHHGQHIENVHLLPYESEEDFFKRLYDGPYSRLLGKAQEFVENTGTAQDDVLVFIRLDIKHPIHYLGCADDSFLVVGSTHANMNIRQCRDTIGRFLSSFIIASRKTRARLQTSLRRERLLVFWKGSSLADPHNQTTLTEFSNRRVQRPGIDKWNYSSFVWFCGHEA